jgi:hypothetical protein
MAAEGIVANHRFLDAIEQSFGKPDFGALGAAGKLPGKKGRSSLKGNGTTMHYTMLACGASIGRAA